MAKACHHTHHGHRGRLSPFLGVPGSSDDSYHQAFLVSVTNLLKEAGRCVYQWRLIHFNAVETKLMSDCVSSCLGISCWVWAAAENMVLNRGQLGNVWPSGGSGACSRTMPPLTCTAMRVVPGESSGFSQSGAMAWGPQAGAGPAPEQLQMWPSSFSSWTVHSWRQLPGGYFAFLDIVLSTQWGSKAILDTDSSKQLLLNSV